MTPDRFQEITGTYPRLTIAVIGDFCLDRYLEIDPARTETSIETGRPVHNVTRVRFQPGGAGTVLNNLVALGVGAIVPVGFCGEDAEGHELRHSLDTHDPVSMEHFLTTSERRTFTYCKPLLMYPDRPPEELNRLDFKNWTPTPRPVAERLATSLAKIFPSIDALIVLNQVDLADTGVITRPVLTMLGELVNNRPEIPVLGDSRTGFPDWPPMSFKMNTEEARRQTGGDETPIDSWLAAKARQTGRPAFVTLAEEGILTAAPNGNLHSTPSLPLRGEIDIVGAGDCVTANLVTALAAGALPEEAAILANTAASHVIHQLGTTGAASVSDIAGLMPA
jgi:rfaE bifunctional protein kinase chain/domain